MSDIREALTELVAVIEAAGLQNLTRGVQLGPTSWYVKACDAMGAARAALSKQPQGDPPGAEQVLRDLEVLPLVSVGPPWVRALERMPQRGDLIVKRWDINRAVWAGYYHGTPKESSFDEWVLLEAAPAVDLGGRWMTPT